MRTAVHRHLGKLVAGAAIAVAATAVMIGVTLPSTAGADDTTGDVAAGQAAQGEGGRQGQDDPAEVPPAVVEEAPEEGDEGTGRDPLTDDETERVVRLALNPALRASAEDVDGDRGPQRLGVELAEPEPGELDDPSAPRRADVTFYDYATDRLVTRTVNLDTGEVERTATQRGVQPPPTRAESAEAARLLIADPLGAGLRSDYEDATGKELISPDQLLLNSMVYRAVPGAQPAALDDCGAHRCVRLFPKVKNGPWIDARDFVMDLSTGEVGRLGRD
ncbi:Tat pathway signal sequence domain protein [Streptomyces broussonetiae]|uniref:Tat pathway signal sequence domain protein n=1 Tax=Streptomyces broussonetiae TaxID=2686304 RepID=A0ABV5EHE7_9ACTN